MYLKESSKGSCGFIFNICTMRENGDNKGDYTEWQHRNYQMDKDSLIVTLIDIQLQSLSYSMEYSSSLVPRSKRRSGR